MWPFLYIPPRWSPCEKNINMFLKEIPQMSMTKQRLNGGVKHLPLAIGQSLGRTGVSGVYIWQRHVAFP